MHGLESYDERCPPIVHQIVERDSCSINGAHYRKVLNVPLYKTHEASKILTINFGRTNIILPLQGRIGKRRFGPELSLYTLYLPPKLNLPKTICPCNREPVASPLSRNKVLRYKADRPRSSHVVPGGSQVIPGGGGSWDALGRPAKTWDGIRKPETTWDDLGDLERPEAT